MLANRHRLEASQHELVEALRSEEEASATLERTQLACDQMLVDWRATSDTTLATPELVALYAKAYAQRRKLTQEATHALELCQQAVGEAELELRQHWSQDKAMESWLTQHRAEQAQDQRRLEQARFLESVSHPARMQGMGEVQ